MTRQSGSSSFSSHFSAEIKRNYRNSSIDTPLIEGLNTKFFTFSEHFFLILRYFSEKSGSEWYKTVFIERESLIKERSPEGWKIQRHALLGKYGGRLFVLQNCHYENHQEGVIYIWSEVKYVFCFLFLDSCLCLGLQSARLAMRDRTSQNY